jgi:hypothetical protein
VPLAGKSIKQQLRDYLEAEKPAAITDSVWTALRMRLAPVSESYLRDLYRAANATGDRERARYCRRQVIAAKDRARFLVPQKPEKEEMAQWMLVWLENPEVFPAWIGARKKTLSPSSSPAGTPECT